MVRLGRSRQAVDNLHLAIIVQRVETLLHLKNDELAIAIFILQIRYQLIHTHRLNLPVPLPYPFFEQQVEDSILQRFLMLNPLTSIDTQLLLPGQLIVSE